MPNAKSKFAAQFSINDMNEQLYFWTFTYAKALSIKDAVKVWHQFLGNHTKPRTLLKAYPNMSGIRVFEMHPGKRIGGEERSHGLHIHCLVNEFLNVNVVRSLWELRGGGRLQVEKVKRGEAQYVGKYLGKARIECMKGMRLWAPIGYCETHKVKDIVVDSRWTATYQFIAATWPDFRKLPWNEKIFFTTRVMGGEHLESIMRDGGHEIYYLHDAEAKEEMEVKYWHDELDEEQDDYDNRHGVM